MGSVLQESRGKAGGALEDVLQLVAVHAVARLDGRHLTGAYPEELDIVGVSGRQDNAHGVDSLAGPWKPEAQRIGSTDELSGASHGNETLAAELFEDCAGYGQVGRGHGVLSVSAVGIDQSVPSTTCIP